MPAPIQPKGASPVDSGRVFEALMEEEHLLGKRMVISAVKIVERLQAKGPVPLTSMSLLVYLVLHLIDPVHHRKEEQVLIPLALARGMSPASVAWVYEEHEQGRAYFRGMELALNRIRQGDALAADAFIHNAQGFIELYKLHGGREDNTLFPEIGRLLTDADDSLIINLLRQIGPSDITPYLSLIETMENELGITPG